MSVYNAQKLAEFALTRQAIGRGGEQVFFCWTEARWDEYFNAPDFDWPVIKQSVFKCILLFVFGDRYIYSLCPLFCLGVFMLFGGLRRDGSETGAIVNYVFPSLHGMKQESVAASLTKMIKKYVKA